jgi:hypothetical protein
VCVPQWFERQIETGAVLSKWFVDRLSRSFGCISVIARLCDEAFRLNWRYRLYAASTSGGKTIGALSCSKASSRQKSYDHSALMEERMGA